MALIDWKNFSRISKSPKLCEVQFAIECTDTEWDFVIAQYHEKWDSWQQYCEGFVTQIGHGEVDGEKFPINIEFTFWRINGFVFAYYGGCSMLVHHAMVENYVRKNCPRVDWYRTHSNAANFQNVQAELDRLQRQDGVRR